jgi:hypothetical protein
MRRQLFAALVILAALAAQSAANAATAVVTGTIVTLSVTSPEWVVFNMSDQPPAASTGCSAPAAYFAFSPTSITDANSRRDLLALLMMAKAAGMTVLVSYDNAGANCDASGYPSIYTIMIQP